MKREFIGLMRGPAQVMFQANALTGLLFLIGIFWGALSIGQGRIAFGGLVGLTAATLTGYLLPLPVRDGEAGLWGFNGVLVGLAMMTFLGDSPLAWGALVLCSAMTTWARAGLDRVGATHKVSSLTMPFVLSTWIFLAAARLFVGLDEVALSHPMLPAAQMSEPPATMPTTIWEAIVWPLRGVAQIMLLDSWVTGALFLIGLAVSSPWAALWCFVGSTIGTYGAILYGASATVVEAGLYGFSPALTAIALGCTFHRPSPSAALWAIIGAAATLFVQAAVNLFLEPLGLPALTAPFCLTTWLFLLPMFKFGRDGGKEPDHSVWHHHSA